MTAATLSRLPLSAGGAVAGSLARGGLWTLTQLIDFGSRAVGQFMRAPLAISTVAVVAGLSALAGSNALYFQTHRHPAPLFYEPPHHVVPAPVVRPVIPATRPRPPAVDSQTTGSLGNAPAADSIDNAQVMALQQKLAALKLLDGRPDGVFGRHTAAAIRAFEASAGMKPRGELTRQVLAAVLAAPLDGGTQALPAPTTMVAAAPSARSVPGKPVPLAPLRAVPQQVANAVPAPAAAAQPAAQVTPTATPQTVAAAPAPVAQPAGAVTDSTVDGNTVAMNNLPAPAPQPVAAAAPSAQALAAAAQPEAAPAAPTADAPLLSAAQKLAAQMGTLPPQAIAPSVAAPAASADDSGAQDGSTDPALITKIQRALASLGFLGQKIDGVPGEGTAKAIRNFQVFYDYKVTGEATPQVLQLLIQHGAQT